MMLGRTYGQSNVAVRQEKLRDDGLGYATILELVEKVEGMFIRG
jgi:hypothetical protein